jgi:hypothetical protein
MNRIIMNIEEGYAKLFTPVEEGLPECDCYVFVLCQSSKELFYVDHVRFDNERKRFMQNSQIRHNVLAWMDLSKVERKIKLIESK